MVDLKVILFLAFLSFVSSESEIVDPCDRNDDGCIQSTTNKFLESVSKGIPEYDVRPLDPIIIPSVEYAANDNLSGEFKNVNITGLKAQKIEKFKLDPEKKFVSLTTRIAANIVSDLIIKYDGGKEHSGTYSAKSEILATAKYNYDFSTDDKGVEHFVIGPETISCESLQIPEFTLNDEFKTFIANEPSLKDRKTNPEISKKVFCKMIEAAFVTFVHNIRAIAKVLPKDSFFKNL